MEKIENCNIESCNFQNIMCNVKNELIDRYSEWIQQVAIFTPILHTILTHELVIKSEFILSTNVYPKDVSKFGLIRFEHDINLSRDWN